MIVDAHQHFWDPGRGDYGWLTPDKPIHRIYDTNDLRPLLVATGVDATILVQAAPTPAETDYLLGIAARAKFVLGVVGWVDLAAPDAADAVRRRADDPLFLGLRPMLQDLPDPDWILNPALAPALNAVAAEGLVFDALVLSHQIAAVTEIARRHPQLSIVLDHAAKPRFGKSGAMKQWRADLAELAECPNVACKFSGLLTEGGDRAGIFHAADVLLTLFGPERLIWGSDWPVLTLAGDYQGWFDLAREAIAAKSPQSVPAIMGANALRVYRPRR